MTEENHWTIDRRVPIALIAGLAVQFGAAVWWASAMDARMTGLEASDEGQAAQLDALSADAQRMQVSAATVSAQLSAVRESITELKDAQRETNDLLHRYLENRP